MGRKIIEKIKQHPVESAVIAFYTGYVVGAIVGIYAGKKNRGK